MVETKCPTPEVLKQFLLGVLSAEEWEPLSKHFETCSPCAEVADSISADDTVSEAMRASDTVFAKGPDAYVEQVIAQVIAKRSEAFSSQEEKTHLPGTAAPSGSTSQVDLSFLSPAQSDGELGRLGTYRILKVLDVGGMGVVFEAEDPQLKRRVAVKAIKPGHAGATSDRFLREARATAALEHDNIVTIYQVGEDCGVPFLAMQFLRGESLQARLRREMQTSPADALRIAREAAQGLACAHRHGLLHRDIKPDNLWLESPTDRVKVVDFGLARFDNDQQNLTEAGAILGTPNYMAPEQVRGETLDARSDLWSLGIVFYQCLTGLQPFAGPNLAATLMKINTAQPPTPHEVDSSIPVEVAQLVMQLLEKDRDARIDTAEKLIAAIDAVTSNDGQPTTSQQPAEASRADSAANAIQPATAVADQPKAQLSAGAAQTEPVRSTSRISWKLALAFALGGVLLAGIVFSLPTKNGTIIVKVSEPGVKVFVDGKEQIVLESEKTGRIEVSSGEHQLIVKRGDEELYTETFKLKSGGETLIEATWKSASDSVAAKGKAPEVTPSKGGAAEVAAKKTVRPVSPIEYHLMPSAIEVGEPISEWTMVSSPAQIEGVKSWTIETVETRDSPNRNAIAYSRDGKLIAVGSNGVVRVWDAQTGTLQNIFIPRPAGTIQSLDWSVDGALGIAAGSWVHAWKDGKALGRKHVKLASELSPVQSVAWSPDGKVLAYAAAQSRGEGALWDVTTGEIESNIPISGNAPEVKWFDDQQLLIADRSSSSSITLWNRTTKKPMVRQSTPNRGGIAVKGVLVVPRGTDTTAFEIKDNRFIPRKLLLPTCTDFEFLDEGRIIIDEGNALGIYNLGDGRKLTHLNTHSKYAITPDGSSVVAQGYDVLRVRENSTKQIWTIPANNTIPGRALLSPSGRYLAGNLFLHHTFKSYVWDLLTGEAVAMPNYYRGSAWSPDERNFAGTTTVVTWPETKATVQILADPSVLSTLLHLIYSPDGLTLASLNVDGTIYLHNAQSGILRKTISTGITGGGVRLAFSNDGTRLVVGGRGQLKVYNPADGTLLKQHTGPNGEYPDLSLSPDGHLLAYPLRDHQAFVIVMNIDNGQIVHKFSTGNTGATSVQWLKDGQTLFAGTISNGAGRLDTGRAYFWNTKTGKLVRQLTGPANAVLSSDERLLVGSMIENAHQEFWKVADAKTGKTLQSLVPLPDGYYLTVNAEGHYRISPEWADKIVYVAETDEGQAIYTPAEFTEKYGWKNDPDKVKLK